MKSRFILIVLAALSLGLLTGCSKSEGDGKVDLKAEGAESKPDPGAKSETAP